MSASRPRLRRRHRQPPAPARRQAAPRKVFLSVFACAPFWPRLVHRPDSKSPPARTPLHNVVPRTSDPPTGQLRTSYLSPLTSHLLPPTTSSFVDPRFRRKLQLARPVLSAARDQAARARRGPICQTAFG